MHLFKNGLPLSILFIALAFWVKAQVPAGPADGYMSGKVVDAANGQPVEFATVALFKKTDNQIARSIQTDLQGSFKIDNVAYGRYLLRITFVGYTNFVRDSIQINAGHKGLVLGTLKMRAGKNSLLKEVTVQTKKSSIQLGIDRKIFSVDQSLISDGGSATDLLTNVPSVQVDVDGNVSLRGSNNVRILIDGKPSLLAGGTVADILASIPASSIETVELITNPSSKYDPEGQSGIINIVLKKNKSLGFNGSASVSMGNNNAYNGNLNLAYQHKKVNLYGNYSHRQGDRTGGGYSYRTNLLSPSRFDQTSQQIGGQNGNQIKAGIDYNITNSSTLGLSSNINFRDNNRGQNSLTYGFDGTGAQVQRLLSNSYSPGSGNNHDLNLDYSKKFKRPKEELTANVSLAQGDEDNTDMLNNGQYNTLSGVTIYTDKMQLNTNDGNSRNVNLQADYTDPVGRNGKLEIGYRSTLNRADNNFVANVYNFTTKQYVYDPTISTDFVYDEKTHAIYSNYQQQFGKFGVQGGARVEKTIINTNLVNFNNSHVQDYFRVYPSLFLTDKLSDDQTLQLSYSRRINRPRDRQIIPFLDRSDALNYRTGNPDLQPEDVHSFELSYARYWKATTLTSSVYYRRTNQIFQFLRTPYDNTGIYLTDYYNFNYGTNAGFEFIARTDITPKWNVTSNLNIFHGFVKGGPLHTQTATIARDTVIGDNSSFAWNGNVTSNFQLPLGFSGQLRLDYQAPQAIILGNTKANYGMDAALKYELFKRRASLSLNARDIFDTRKFGYTSNDGIFANNIERRYQTRTILLTLSYRFGSGDAGRDKAKKDKPDNSSTPDEGGGGGPQ